MYLQRPITESSTTHSHVYAECFKCYFVSSKTMGVSKVFFWTKMTKIWVSMCWTIMTNRPCVSGLSSLYALPFVPQPHQNSALRFIFEDRAGSVSWFFLACWWGKSLCSYEARNRCDQRENKIEYSPKFNQIISSYIRRYQNT